MKLMIILLLCTHMAACRPIDPKETQDIDTPTVKKPRTDEPCYFSQTRQSHLELHPRPEKSKVSSQCNTELKKLSDSFHVPINKKTGEQNATSLLLCRGAGECDLDFDDPVVVQKWKDVPICQHHLEELLTKWSDSHSTFKHSHIYHKKSDACSMPAEIEPSHTSRPETLLRELTIQESQTLLKNTGYLIHPGIPICRNHIDSIKKMNGVQGTQDESSIKIDDDDVNTCNADSSNIFSGITHGDPVGDSLRQFAKCINVDRVCFPRKPFDDLEERTKQKKVCAVKKMIDAIVDKVAPTNAEEFKKRVISKYEDKEGWTTGSTKQLDEVLKQVRAQFLSADSRKEKQIILGLVANSVTLAKIREYIPDLSSYLFTDARRFARRDRNNDEPIPHNRERYNPQAIQSFVTFITDPTVMIGLPSGSRTVTYSDGSKEVIPNSIRQQCATEIDIMYNNYLEETNQKELSLSKSSIFGILKVCAATSRKATTCVDYFIANGMKAFEDLHKFLDEWLTNRLAADEILEYLKKGLHEAAQYLRTDFRLHIKSFSRVADHCANFALSDPFDTKFSSSCSDGPHAHKHDYKCDRCEVMNSVLTEILSLAETFLTNAEEELALEGSNPTEKSKKNVNDRKEDVESIKLSIAAIHEMKKHLLRSAFTSQERQKIVNSLKDNEAVVILDFAQKYLPTWHRETQTDYFAKRGISYHVAHVTAKIGESYVTHTFVHIYNQEIAQDSHIVVQTVSHIASALKEVGITRISLRSDNAGAYHCASTIHSLHSIQTETGILIDTYTFSEAQNGKSASDRAASQVKYRAERYVSQGHDILTPEDFFAAMKHEPILNGFSFHLGTVTTEEGEDAKWKGISTLNHFKVEENGIRAFRYGSIGEGILIAKESLRPVKGSHDFESTGFVSEGVSVHSERYSIENGLATKFWYYNSCTKDKTCTEESDLSADDIDDSVRNDEEIGKMYSCTEPGCTASFLKPYNLEKHVLKDQHKKSPEKLTMRDYALKLFSQTLERVETEHTSMIATEALNKYEETRAQTSLTMGYGLPKKQVRKPFGSKVINWLISCFDEGLKKKAKPMDPIVVARRMETEKDSSGEKMFAVEDRLTARQIAGFFSREAQKRRSTTRSKREDASGTQTDDREYFPDEDEHDDAELIRWIKDPAYETPADSMFDAAIHSDLFYFEEDATTANP